MAMRWIRRVVQSLLVSPEALAATPLLASHQLAPERVCAVAGVHRLAELGPRNVSVVSIARLQDQSLRLVELRQALERGVLLLFVGAESEQEQLSLEAVLPGIAVRVDLAGPESRRALYAVNVTVLLRACLAADTRAALREVLRGMSTQRMRRDALALVPEDFPVRRVDGLQRWLRHPSLPVYLIVFVYSSLRVLPVAFIREFHGSLLVLWAIDVLTAVPYTWGVLAMIFAPRPRIRLLAAATTVVTFVGPYVYFWFNGRGYPPYVPIVIAVLTVTTVLLELNRYLQEQRLRRRYCSAASDAPALTAVR